MTDRATTTGAETVPTDADVLADPSRANAAWLQRHIDRPVGMVRCLPAGCRVDAFELEPLEATTARVLRLRVRYREALPVPVRWAARLILKCCEVASGIDPESEPTYYARDYVGLEDSPLVPCLDACTVLADDLRPLGYLLLLADVSERYRDHKFVAPLPAHARALGEALARLHAHRWHRDREVAGRARLHEDLDRFLEHVRGGLDPVLATLDGTLGQSRTEALRACFAGPVDELRARLADPHGIVMIHGDPNPTNVLTTHDAEAPVADDERTLYLLDRQPFRWSPRLWPAAADLVGASVPWWSPEARRELEPVLLRGYHRALREHGVVDYAWTRLLEDYRTCLAHAVWIGVEWGADPEDLHGMRFLWQVQIERGLAAIEDWREAVPMPVAVAVPAPGDFDDIEAEP